MTIQEIEAETVQLKTEAERLDAETRKLMAEERNQWAQTQLAIINTSLTQKKAKWYEVVIACSMAAVIGGLFVKAFFPG